MRKFAILLLTAFFAVPAQAAVISTGVWTPVDWTEINRDGAPFWDGPSYDGEFCGAGAMLATTETCKVRWGSGLTNLEYLNDGSGNAVPFLFSGLVNDPGFEGIASITAWDNAQFGVNVGWTNETVLMGWDDIGRTKQPISDLSGPWHVWFKSKHGHYASTGNFDQFALFRQVNGDTTTYWVAIEDIRQKCVDATIVLEDEKWCEVVSDYDFNDYLVSMSQTNPDTPPVPEPTTLALMGLGLLGARYMRRRR